MLSEEMCLGMFSWSDDPYSQLIFCQLLDDIESRSKNLGWFEARIGTLRLENHCQVWLNEGHLTEEGADVRGQGVRVLYVGVVRCKHHDGVDNGNLKKNAEQW